MDSFKLAMIQMRVEAARPDVNLDRAEEHVREAARQGADVALLPEAFDVGWTHPAARELAEPIPEGARYRRLEQLARELGLFLCAGLTERAGGRVYNTAVLISPEGELLRRHRKINELEIGHDLYGLGRSLEVCETDLGAIGILICADAFARDLSLLRALAYMGADVILSPSAWAVPLDHDESMPYGRIWHEAYEPIARDFEIYIAGLSGVGPVAAGPWSDHRCIGSSLLYGPDGEVQASGPYDREWMSLEEIHPRPRRTQGCGWANYWGVGHHG